MSRRSGGGAPGVEVESVQEGDLKTERGSGVGLNENTRHPVLCCVWSPSSRRAAGPGNAEQYLEPCCW